MIKQFVIKNLTATGNHMRYRITQCYLPPGSGDFPAFTPAEAGTRFSDPGGMQGCVNQGNNPARLLQHLFYFIAHKTRAAVK